MNQFISLTKDFGRNWPLCVLTPCRIISHVSECSTKLLNIFLCLQQIVISDDIIVDFTKWGNEKKNFIHDICDKREEFWWHSSVVAIYFVPCMHATSSAWESQYVVTPHFFSLPSKTTNSTTTTTTIHTINFKCQPINTKKLMMLIMNDVEEDSPTVLGERKKTLVFPKRISSPPMLCNLRMSWQPSLLLPFHRGYVSLQIIRYLCDDEHSTSIYCKHLFLCHIFSCFFVMKFPQWILI